MGQINRVATLTPINLGFLSQLGGDLFPESIPAFQVAQAELVPGCTLVAGPHAEQANF